VVCFTLIKEIETDQWGKAKQPINDTISGNYKRS